MAKQRLNRAQTVRMKRSIVENVKLILDCNDKLSKDKMIEEECDKYDWYRDVVNYLGIERILELDCNIFDLKKEVYEKKLEEGMEKLVSVFEYSMERMREYMILSEKIKYGLFLTHRQCSDTLTEVCEELELPKLNSSAYFTLLYDVKPSADRELNTSGYLIKGPLKEDSYSVGGRIRSASTK